MASTITVEQFEELVFTYARTHGQPFIKWQDRANLREFISRQLRRFVEQTMVLYDDNVTFTTTSSDTTYDLLNTGATAVFSKAVLQPEAVLVSGEYLLNEDDEPGLVSVAEANRWASNYRGLTRARPQKALLIPPSTLRLIPQPDAAYSCVLCGWVQHTDLTASGIVDTTDLDLRHGSIDAAAQFIAGELLLPGAEGPTVAAAVALRDLGLNSAVKASSRAASFLQGRQVRPLRRQTIYSLS